MAKIIKVRCTGAGQHEHEIDLESIVGPETVCYDLSYAMTETPFVAWSREHDCAHAYQGWGMLVEQAAESFMIWRGVRPETREVLRRLR